MTDVAVINDVERARYEIRCDGEVAGFAEYVSAADEVRFVHTELLPQHGGKGYGSKLAAAAVADARLQGKRVVAECEFIAAYLKKNP